jgi:hypothetical protein
MNKPYLNKLKPLVNSTTQWKAFEEMLESYVEQQRRKLEQVSDLPDMYKAQGAIAALRQLKYLKDEVNASE